MPDSADLVEAFDARAARRENRRDFFKAFTTASAAAGLPRSTAFAETGGCPPRLVAKRKDLASRRHSALEPMRLKNIPKGSGRGKRMH